MEQGWYATDGMCMVVKHAVSDANEGRPWSARTRCGGYPRYVLKWRIGDGECQKIQCTLNALLAYLYGAHSRTDRVYNITVCMW